MIQVETLLMEFENPRKNLDLVWVDEKKGKAVDKLYRVWFESMKEKAKQWINLVGFLYIYRCFSLFLNAKIVLLSLFYYFIFFRKI